MAKKVRIPLVGSFYHRNYDDADVLPGISSIDQRFVNVLFKRVQNPLTGAIKIWACKRPGIDTGTAITISGGGTPISTGYTSSILPHDANVGSLVNTAIYPVDANTVTLVVGNISSSSATVTGHFACSRITIFTNAIGDICAASHVRAGTGSNSKGFYSTATTVLTEITDSDFPKSDMRGNFVYKDGYLFCITNNPARIYNSDLNAPSVWSADGFITTNQGGEGRSLALYKDTIVAFGDKYIEFYRNSGNPSGSPLQRIKDTQILGYGLAGGKHASPIASDPGQRVFEGRNTIFWINNPDSDGGSGVYMLDGFQPKLISPPDVNLDLSRHSVDELHITGIVEIFDFNYLTIGSYNTNDLYIWAYCFELSIWATWTSALFGTLVGVMNNSGELAGKQDEILLLSDIKIYKMDISSMLYSDISYTDNNVAVPMSIQIGGEDYGTTKRKRFNSIAIAGSRPRATSATGISYSDDDGVTYSTARNVDMNEDYPRLTRLGMARKRSWRITNSANTAFQAHAIDIEMDELSS